MIGHVGPHGLAELAVGDTRTRIIIARNQTDAEDAVARVNRQQRVEVRSGGVEVQHPVGRRQEGEPDRFAAHFAGMVRLPHFPRGCAVDRRDRIRAHRIGQHPRIDEQVMRRLENEVIDGDGYGLRDILSIVHRHHADHVGAPVQHQGVGPIVGAEGGDRQVLVQGHQNHCHAAAIAIRVRRVKRRSSQGQKTIGRDQTTQGTGDRHHGCVRVRYSVGSDA